MTNPTYIEEKDYFSFSFPNGFTYDIAKNRIKTNKQLDWWERHLQEKVWMSSQLLEQFEKSVLAHLNKIQ